MRHSPNVNEPGHLVAALSHWQLGRFELFRVNPPLVRMIAALPVLAAGAETDWSGFHEHPGARPVHMLGADLLEANGARSLWLITLGRWACIPLSLLGGYICYRWARELYGSYSGLLAATLWCASPNILGHAAFFTPDPGATAVGLAASYCFWRWLKQLEWPLAIGTGLLLGCALLTKTTWILLLALWPVVWLIWAQMQHPDEPPVSNRTSIMQLLTTLLLGLHVLNSGYGYDGSFRKLGDFEFVSRMMGGATDDPRSREPRNRFAHTWLGDIRAPVPEQYMLGIDVQKWDFETQPVSYFRGQLHSHGRWYYYLYAMGIKVPIGTWLLALLALIHSLSAGKSSVHTRDELVPLAMLFLILAVVSSQTEYNGHMRYALLIFPYGFIWISKVARQFQMKGSKLGIAAALALSWSVGSSLWHYPHSLAYFNELAGGPRNGHAHLSNSNIDWGQDLLYLKRWLDDHPEARPIGLAYYGLFNPTVAGLEFNVPSEQANVTERAGNHEDPSEETFGLQPGWYAVSVNFLRGHSFWRWNPDGTRGWHSKASFAYFQHFEPVASVGYSIYIYHLTPQDLRNRRFSRGEE